MSRHLPQTTRVAVNADNPALARDESLCVKCTMCAQICSDYIGVNNNYSLAATGDRARVRALRPVHQRLPDGKPLQSHGI